jgi:hypothetical protein
VSFDMNWAGQSGGLTVEIRARVEAPETFRKLDAFSLKEIAGATGLSLAACSRIRAGAKVPHPRHWQALRKLADS